MLCYLRVEDTKLLLELGNSDGGSGGLGGDVDLGVLDQVVTVVNDTLKRALALVVTVEGGTLKETKSEELSKNQVGKNILNTGNDVPLLVAFQFLGSVALEDALGNELLSAGAVVHHGLEGEVVEAGL